MTTHSPLSAAPTAPWLRWTRAIYLAGNLLLVIGIIVQVFWAGAGALVSPVNYLTHTAFGHALQYLAMALLLVGGIGRVPRRIYGLNWLMFGLFVLQYVFLWALPSVAPILRALHAVNGLAMFWLALTISQRARSWLRG